MAKFALITVVSLFVALSSGAPSETYSVKIPDACKNKQFCAIRPEGYDAIEAKINGLLSPHMITKVEHRYGDPPADKIIEANEDNCPSVKSIKSYYLISSGDSNMDIIVQSRKLRQRVEVVNCLYDEIKDKPYNQKCFENLGLIDFDQSTRCQESVSNRTLFFFDPRGHILEKNYSIPVCCSCQITDNQ